MSSITTKTERGVVIVDFTSPELTDQFEAREIGHELTTLADNGAERLLLTLENVTFMGSAMVGQLFVLSHKCHARQAALKICSVPDVIKQVFGIVRLDDFIEVHPDVAAALDAFAKMDEDVTDSPLVSSADDHRAAAAAGDPDAQFELSRCYEEGWGVANDEDEAQQWLEKAAKQGHLDAQFRMGHSYAYGIRVSQDYYEAMKWYEPAAERGQVDAQYAMGMSFHYGVGVPANDEEAVRWYRLAAAQGHAKAEEELAAIDAAGD